MNKNAQHKSIKCFKLKNLKIRIEQRKKEKKRPTYLADGYGWRAGGPANGEDASEAAATGTVSI